jgi:hypothetical protein
MDLFRALCSMNIVVALCRERSRHVCQQDADRYRLGYAMGDNITARKMKYMRAQNEMN